MADLLFDPNEDKSHLINADKRTRRGRLINLEGTDASGKSTQIELICDYLDGIGKTYKKVHFPMYGSNKFAEVISMFLRGDLGKNDEVDPLFVANIYAMDRYKYKPQLYKDLDEYDYVILDRYVFSNMGFQGAKYMTEEKRQSIVKWINDFEFDFLKLPYPDLIIYFDLPIDVIADRINKRNTEEDREYLDGKKDIHESDLTFQSRVRRIYLGLDTFENYKIINCIGDEGQVLTPMESFSEYLELI
jgi:dTMP kinase